MEAWGIAAIVEELQRLKDAGEQWVPFGPQVGEQTQPVAAAPLKTSAGLQSQELVAELRELREPEPVAEFTQATEAQELSPLSAIILPEGDKRTQWNWLRERVLSCPACTGQVKPGKQVVFGVGSLEAELFFCGEAPGAEEEIQGEPFVGPAGQLLTRIIQAMGLAREHVYIGNIMNFRPPMPTALGNRPPTEEEMALCLPYLKAQLAIVRPKVIIALGATAAKGLLGTQGAAPMRQLRGQWFQFENTPLTVTYHPSYLLHNNSLEAKRAVWEDMMGVLERVQHPISDKQRAYFS